MTVERRIVHVDPDSELGATLHDAAETHDPVIVNAGTDHYELTVARVDAGDADDAGDSGGTERVDRTIAAIQRATGSWAGLVNTDALLEDVYERRRAVSDRPVR